MVPVVLAAAALLRWWLGDIVGNTVPMTLFYPAVALATFLGGLGPGLLTVAIGAVIGGAFFAAPPAPGSPEWLGESVRLALFVFVGVLLSLLVEVARNEGHRADRSARAARDAEQKWASLVEGTDATVAIADADGRIHTIARPRSGRPEARSGATLLDGIDTRRHDAVAAALSQVFGQGVPAQFEVASRRPDGGEGWTESRLVPIRGDGGVQAALVISSDVTERRRAEESLRQNEARFRGLFESSLDATFIADDEGRFMDVNPAACTLFGLPSGDLLGRGIWEFSGNRAAFDAAWARFLTDGELRGEWDLTLADGRPLAVEFSARARFLPGRHLSVLRDIGARRRAQRTSEFLARAARALAASLDERETARALAAVAVPELADWCGVDVEDELGEVYRVALAAADARREEAAWELTRAYPPDGLAGAALNDVLRTGEAWSCADVEAAVRPGADSNGDHVRLLRACGLRSVMAVPLASRGRTIGVLWFGGGETRPPFGAPELALARDLAERAGVALENARLYKSAQQANRVKDEFLATLSHELRTPLNAIVGWTHLLRTSELDGATSQRALETIERNARLQSQLIADILDVSRIVSGKLRIESTPVDLGHIVTAAVDAVRPSADAKGVTVAAEVRPEVVVSGDPGRLQQVAQNLLQNAVKFTGRGGEIHVALLRAGASAELRVSDTGIGIAADLLPHVFERFRQGDSSTTRPHGGLGLGLAITRHLVEAHGGSVEAASQGTGQGAAFTVRLPLIARAEAAQTAAGARGPVELAGIRVLVVDDHADGRTVLGTILERAGASVAHAATSREAFATLEEFQPHVLVSDIGLPDEDGFALVARVRSLAPENGGGIPAVAVTGHARAEEMARALAAGFQRHLAKPVDPLELASVVAQLAQRRQPAHVLD